jgi:GNAT superfamily N-acetyltransferase
VSSALTIEPLIDRVGACLIRRATEADGPALVRMALRFQETPDYAAHLRATPATFARLIWALLHDDGAAVWVAQSAGVVQGLFAATVYPHPMSGEVMGQEFAWWLEPDARGGQTARQLLETAEAWARERGAVRFQMAAPAGSRVGTWYRRLGYTAVETHYMRELA